MNGPAAAAAAAWMVAACVFENGHLPNARPSAEVFEPPNGKGCRTTSADASSLWNSFPADVRGRTFT